MRTTQSLLASRLAATMTRHRALSIAGAAAGLTAFFAVALLPSLLHGGQAGVLLAGEALMGPGAATPGVRALITFGMGFGVLATAVAALGAAAGSGVPVLVRAPAVGAARRQARSCQAKS